MLNETVGIRCSKKKRTNFLSVEMFKQRLTGFTYCGRDFCSGWGFGCWSPNSAVLFFWPVHKKQDFLQYWWVFFQNHTFDSSHHYQPVAWSLWQGHVQMLWASSDLGSPCIFTGVVLGPPRNIGQATWIHRCGPGMIVKIVNSWNDSGSSWTDAGCKPSASRTRAAASLEPKCRLVCVFCELWDI